LGKIIETGLPEIIETEQDDIQEQAVLSVAEKLRSTATGISHRN